MSFLVSFCHKYSPNNKNCDFLKTWWVLYESCIYGWVHSKIFKSSKYLYISCCLNIPSLSVEFKSKPSPSLVKMIEGMKSSTIYDMNLQCKNPALVGG